MAKLSETQKNNIVAKWNTGEYNKSQLAKAYKVTEKVIRNIVGLEKPSSVDIVEAQVMLEKYKKSEKSPNEVTAINSAVAHRLKQEFSDDNNRIKIYETTTSIIEKVQTLIENGKAQKATTANAGDGIIESNIIETDLQSADYKNAQETIDKASITLGVNQRHSSSQLSIQNNQTQNTGVKIEWA